MRFRRSLWPALLLVGVVLLLGSLWLRQEYSQANWMDGFIAGLGAGLVTSALSLLFRSRTSSR